MMRMRVHFEGWLANTLVVGLTAIAKSNGYVEPLTYPYRYAALADVELADARNDTRPIADLGLLDEREEGSEEEE